MSAVADDTATVQAQITAACQGAVGPDGPCAVPVTFGPGAYVLTDTIKNYPTTDMVLTGSGRGTRFIWAGPPGKPMFQFARVLDGAMQGVTFEAETPCDAAICLTNLPASDLRLPGYVTSNIGFEDVQVAGQNGNFKYGFVVDPTIGGGVDENNENHHWTNVKVLGATEYALSVKGSQAHRLTLDRFFSHGLGVGKGAVYTDDIVSMSIRGGGGGHHTGYDLDFGYNAVGGTTIAGWNSEGSKGFLRCRSFPLCKSPYWFTVEDLRFEGILGDDPVVKFGDGAHCVRWHNNFLSSLLDGTDPGKPIVLDFSGSYPVDTNSVPVGSLAISGEFRTYGSTVQPVVKVPSWWTVARGDVRQSFLSGSTNEYRQWNGLGQVAV